MPNILEVLRGHGVGTGKKLVGNAQPEEVLSSKTFSNADGNDKVGTMPNRGQVIITPGTGNVVISAGYHSGVGYVKGDPDLVTANVKAGTNIFGVAGKTEVVDTADANAIASAILAGYAGYSGGVKRIGTMVNKDISGTVITPSTVDQIIPEGWYPGNLASGKVVGDVDLIATNIRSGKNVFGVAGSLIEGVDLTGHPIYGYPATPQTHDSYSLVTVNGAGWYLCGVNWYSSSVDHVVEVDGYKFRYSIADDNGVSTVLLRFESTLVVTTSRNYSNECIIILD